MDFDFSYIKKKSGLSFSEKREPSMTPYFIKNKKLHNILILNAPFICTPSKDGGIKIFQDTSIWIENGVIQDVCKKEKARRYEPNADLIYNASKKGGVLITPGFINTHAHSHMYLMRSAMLLEEGEDIDRTIAAMPLWQQFETDETMSIAAIGDITEQQKYGITTTLSQGPSFDALELAAQFTKQRVINAVSAVSNSRPQNTPELIERILQGDKNYASAPSVSVHYLYKTSNDVLKKIKSLVCDYGIIFTFHLAESPFVREQCIKNFGCSEVDRLEKEGLLTNRTICSHAIHIQDHEIKKIIRARVGIAHLPTSNATHKSGRFALELFYKLGGQDLISLGTDSVISKNRLDLLTESFQTKLTHLNFHPLTYTELFKMITINGAGILGLNDIGIIEAGMSADLAFWKLNDRGLLPYDEKNVFTLIGNLIAHGGRAVHDLMVKGRFVISNYTHNFVEEKNLLETMQKKHMLIRKKFRKLADGARAKSM